MGMSASQARFLILTAQKNNNEYQAQRITHERLVLAQNTERWTMEYNDKMNNKTLLFNLKTAADTDLYNYNRKLTYNDIVGSPYDEANPGLGARLTTNTGKTIVPAMPSPIEIARYNGKTVVGEVTQEMKNELLASMDPTKVDFNLDGTISEDELNKLVDEKYYATGIEGQETLPPIENSVYSGLKEEDYFVDPTITNPENLQMALTNGVYFISMLKYDPSNPIEASWQEVNYANTTETLISEVLDKTDDAAAQAEYDKRNSSFQQKDKMLELRLKQLESEHKALETEMESVKKVIQEDVESSFKTFG